MMRIEQSKTHRSCLQTGRHQIKSIRKWHIQREDNRQQEEIREEPTTKRRFLNWQKMQLLAKCTFITELTGAKENYTTEEK